MITKLKEWSNSPYEKPHGWKDNGEGSFVGRLAGAWHTRHDCDGYPHTNGAHNAALFVETFALMILIVGDFTLTIIAWLASMVPHVLQWGAVTIVGLAIASAIAVAGIAIGVDMSYQDMVNFNYYEATSPFTARPKSLCCEN